MDENKKSTEEIYNKNGWLSPWSKRIRYKLLKK